MQGAHWVSTDTTAMVSGDPPFNSAPTRATELGPSQSPPTLNEYSPINRLPPEILAAIPSFLVRDRDRIVVTHVCRRWRDTFLSIPTLWDDVTASRNPEKTAAYLDRSRDRTLSVSITACRAGQSTGWYTSFQMLCRHSHRFGAMRLFQDRDYLDGEDAFVIMKNPLPRLTRLELDIPAADWLIGRMGPHPFPPLESLTLASSTAGTLRYFQPSNLRKLGVCCDPGFVLLSLSKCLARTPLLEELEFEIVPHAYMGSNSNMEDVHLVVLEHLQQIIFRGVRSKNLRFLISHIIYPHHTKITLACHIPSDHNYLYSHVFPQGFEFPVPTPPKYIRYRVVHDEDFSETGTYIDLISTDGRHTLIENRHSWPGGYFLGVAELWTTEARDEPCFDFLRTTDLSSVEKFCFEGCDLDPDLVEEFMGVMDKLGTLVVVNGDPLPIFTGIQNLGLPEVMCPLMRRLVVRYDLNIDTQWRKVVDVVKSRAVQGSPLELVTLTSSFCELFEGPAMSVEQLEEITEVKYDLGRSTFGWEWWKE